MFLKLWVSESEVSVGVEAFPVPAGGDLEL